MLKAWHLYYYDEERKWPCKIFENRPVTSPDERKRVLRDAPESLHSALTKVARLVLTGKLKLASELQTRVLRHINAIRKLAHLKTSKKERADMLRPQRGGFLDFLAPLLGANAGPFLGKLFK